MDNFDTNSESFSTSLYQAYIAALYLADTQNDGRAEAFVSMCENCGLPDKYNAAAANALFNNQRKPEVAMAWRGEADHFYSLYQTFYKLINQYINNKNR